jgi:hypothetical protein
VNPDGAPMQKVILVHQFLAENKYQQMNTPPPPQSHQILSHTKPPKGTHIKSNEDVHKKTAELLKTLPQNNFMGCFKAKKAPMEQCVASDGKCFKGATF